MVQSLPAMLCHRLAGIRQTSTCPAPKDKARGELVNNAFVTNARVNRRYPAEAG